MATIKSYTDIEQSKKLAEILPLESVDMKWFFWKVGIDALKTPTFGYSKTTAESYKDTEAVYLACWSLAALINVLPRSIEFKGDKYYLRFMKDYIEYANNEISITGRCLHTTGNNNLVDACVDMILKLHELNLL